MARNGLNGAELMSMKGYPNFSTNWHFDDKLSQKYLSEALQLPMAPSWAFFERNQALEFANTCALPVVTKLRRGAGSYNVRLATSRTECLSYVRRMFGKGYSPAPVPLADARNKLRVAATEGIGGLKGVLDRLKNAPRFFRVVRRGRKYFGREKGYVYFQKFVPGNDSDVRISVVGDRAWGFRRRVRKGDFRASGSGVIDYDTSKIPMILVAKTFSATRAIGMQSACFDWLCDVDGQWYFTEVSLGFADSPVYNCDGHWDSRLNWHEGHIYPSHAIIEDFIKQLDP